MQPELENEIFVKFINEKATKTVTVNTFNGHCFC